MRYGRPPSPNIDSYVGPISMRSPPLEHPGHCRRLVCCMLRVARSPAALLGQYEKESHHMRAMGSSPKHGMPHHHGSSMPWILDNKFELADP